MVTPLPKNEFISNCATQTAQSAVASKPPPAADATAAPISESTLDPATGVDAAAAPDLTDPPVAAAEPIPVSQGRAVRTARVAHNHEVVGSNPTPATNFGIDCIAEIFAGAAKIDDHRFVLDEHGLLYTIEEGVELPLFIRDGAYLRRWEA